MTSLIRQAAGAVVIGLVGWSIAEFVTATPSKPMALCVCGHAADAHEHYRPGLDCQTCPAGVCDRYRAARPVAVVRPGVEARAQQIHSQRHRAGTASVCGSCRDLAAAEIDASPPCECGCGLAEDAAEAEGQVVRAAFLARRDAALGRPPLV